jgi:hypothetical protein
LGKLQYAYAQRFQLTDASENWQVSFVRALANGLFWLWKIGNRSRNNIENANKSQAQSKQAQQEIQSLFNLRRRVLPQDHTIFSQLSGRSPQQNQAQQRT